MAEDCKCTLERSTAGESSQALAQPNAWQVKLDLRSLCVTEGLHDAVLLAEELWSTIFIVLGTDNELGLLVDISN